MARANEDALALERKHVTIRVEWTGAADELAYGLEVCREIVALDESRSLTRLTAVVVGHSRVGPTTPIGPRAMSS